MEKGCAKFIWSCFNGHNLIVRNISMAAKVSSFSEFGDNYRYLSCVASLQKGPHVAKNLNRADHDKSVEKKLAF